MPRWLLAVRSKCPGLASLVASVTCLGWIGLTTAVAVVASAGLGFLIGHVAVAVLMPMAVLALAVSYRSHRHPLPLGLGLLALGIAYLHVFAATPEWTMALVIALSLFAAVADWWAAKWMPPRWSPQLLNYVRQL